MKRSLFFWVSTTVIVLCIGLQTAMTQEDMSGRAALADSPALLLADHEDSAQNFSTAVVNQNGGNHFDLDFTFKGANGSAPTAALVQDAAGNLYGTTSSGGNGFGVVFKLDSAYHETVLYAFTGPDGATPYGTLVLDGSGNLYGTTSAGGDYGLGTVFKIDPQGVETVLYSFNGIPDGANPYAGVVIDGLGNLYGTTENGGAFGCGTVFKIDTSGVGSVLHSFAGGSTDGSDPKARLILDASGNLYGTTIAGGSEDYGTVFQINSTNTETVLYNFTGGADGGNPFAGVTQDANGVLYGTTEVGGSLGLRPYGCCKGTVFVLNGNNETVLYTFTGANDGGTPASDLVLFNGAVYGTTLAGGPSQKGTVFSVDIATGTESILHGFTGQGDGGIPQGGLLINTTGTLYGTTEGGGRFMKGTVYQQDQ
jgi:uncharacterized repeat protein (TIGR03803 family)